jgi:hypothetical protein
MRSIRSAVIGLAAAGALGLADARAADNCSGYDVLVNQHSDTLELAKDHTLTTSIDYSIVTTDDPKSIYNMATGRCTGTFLVMPGGKVAGAGFCLRKDKDGDTESLAWELPADSDKGTWKMTGGTGKFAGKTDSGWWQPAVNDGKMTVTRWGGTCK